VGVPRGGQVRRVAPRGVEVKERDVNKVEASGKNRKLTELTEM